MRGAVTSFATLTVLAAAASCQPAAAAEPPHRVAIEYQNLTGGLWLSSAPFASHKAGVHLWEVGKAASLPIRELAEEGSPEWVAGVVAGDGGKVFEDSAIATIALPGQTRRVELAVTKDKPEISGGFMLGQTNDGFAGIDAIDAYDLQHKATIDVYALDAGTSKNIETKANLRFLGGFGREPEEGVIHPHPGFSNSPDVQAGWRFDPAKPVARFTITPLAPRVPERGSEAVPSPARLGQ